MDAENKKRNREQELPAAPIITQERYLVKWEIDITASSPREAAQRALAIQRDINSHAQVFEVFDKYTEQTQEIDLIEEEEPYTVEVIPAKNNSNNGVRHEVQTHAEAWKLFGRLSMNFCNDANNIIEETKNGVYTARVEGSEFIVKLTKNG